MAIGSPGCPTTANPRAAGERTERALAANVEARSKERPGTRSGLSSLRCSVILLSGSLLAVTYPSRIGLLRVRRGAQQIEEAASEGCVRDGHEGFDQFQFHGHRLPKCDHHGIILVGRLTRSSSVD